MEVRKAGTCPKGCGRPAGFEVISTEVWTVCSCGFRRLSYSMDAKGEIVPHPYKRHNAALPDASTKLYQCLLGVQELVEINTSGVAQYVHMPSADVATRLATLEGRGLVYRTTTMRGIAGGSTWVLSDAAIRLLPELPKED